MANEPIAFCKICTGPIYAGEMVLHYTDGLAHRFSTWCDHFRKLIAERDANFLKDVGVSNEEN